MRLVGIASILFVLALMFVMSGFGPAATAQQLAGRSRADNERSGQAIFRYDTFGDEQLWTDLLRMHEVIAMVDPATALAVGLKVDVEALPRTIIAALRAGDVDLTNPAVTVELLRLNAVVGVQGKVNDAGESPASASRAPCATLRSTIPSRRASAGGWMDGRTPIWMWGRSWPCRRCRTMLRRQSSTTGPR